jgi:hypothetical protein
LKGKNPVKRCELARCETALKSEFHLTSDEASWPGAMHSLHAAYPLEDTGIFIAGVTALRMPQIFVNFSLTNSLS